jgi:uncharacterized membrane protein
MTDTPPSATPRPRRSWGRIVLIAVLALSLLGNALTLGGLLRLRELRETLVGAGTEAITLPEALRQDLRAALRDRRADLMPALREVLLSRRALIAAMTAQPHDRTATDAAMTAFRADIDRLLAAAQPILLDRLDDR